MLEGRDVGRYLVVSGRLQFTSRAAHAAVEMLVDVPVAVARPRRALVVGGGFLNPQILRKTQ